MTTKKSTPPFPAWMIALIAVLVVLALVYAAWESTPKRPATPTQAPPSSPEPQLPVPAVEPSPGAEFGEWVAAGNQRMDAGMFTDAVRFYTRALELDSTVADVWVDRGACKHALGDEPGAIDDFRRALVIQPLHQIAHFNLGIAFLTSGSPDSARTWWTRLLLVAPSGREAERARALLAQLDSAMAAGAEGP